MVCSVLSGSVCTQIREDSIESALNFYPPHTHTHTQISPQEFANVASLMSDDRAWTVSVAMWLCPMSIICVYLPVSHNLLRVCQVTSREIRYPDRPAVFLVQSSIVCSQNLRQNMDGSVAPFVINIAMRSDHSWSRPGNCARWQWHLWNVFSVNRD